MYGGSSLESEGKRDYGPRKPIMRPPEVDRPRHAEERLAHLERLCGQQALELDVLQSELDG